WHGGLGFSVTKTRQLPNKIVVGAWWAIKLATLFLSRNHRLGITGIESAFKVLGATETAATTRGVKKRAVPNNRASRFYPGRNHDCSRHYYVAGCARTARDASGAQTSASF